MIKSLAGDRGGLPIDAVQTRRKSGKNHLDTAASNGDHEGLILVDDEVEPLRLLPRGQHNGALVPWNRHPRSITAAFESS
jgi:hypothetical protein